MTGLIHWLSNSQKKRTLDFKFERFLYKNFFEKLNFFAIFEKVFEILLFLMIAKDSVQCSVFSKSLFFENTFIVHNFSRSLAIVWLRKFFRIQEISQSHMMIDLENFTKRHVLDKNLSRTYLVIFSKLFLMAWLR